MQQATVFQMEWEEALELLRAELEDRRGHWHRIAPAAEVSYRWLLTFADRRYTAYSTDRVIRLSRALGLPIQVAVAGIPERLQAQLPVRTWRRRGRVISVGPPMPLRASRRT